MNCWRHAERDSLTKNIKASRRDLLPIRKIGIL